MIRRRFEIMPLILFFMCSLGFGVSAECDHDFGFDQDSRKPFYYSDGFHSYYCLKSCGSSGTVSGGPGAKEKCSLTLVFEKVPTCLDEGKRIYMCTVCYNRTEIIVQKTDHSYKKVRKLPTCTEGGYDLYTCVVCGKSYKENVCNPFEHISNGGVVESLPAYGKNGIIVSSCRICGTELDREVLPRLTEIKDKKELPEKVRNFEVKSFTSASVKLIWDESVVADKYKIYYSADKKIWKFKTTSKTYIKLNSLTPAKKYYFKITAVGKDGESEESEVVSACTKPEKAKLTSVKSLKKSTATVRWKKLKNVSGYEICFTAESFDKEKSVKRIEGGKTGKRTIKKLKSGKKYRFRIRAYKVFGSKKIFGAYSKVKTLKIK